MLGGAREDATHFRPEFFGAADEIQRFIGGNTPANNEKNGFSLHRPGSCEGGIARRPITFEKAI
jgi:hypothetical protein